MSGALGRCFFKRCYDLFGELMDALALLNGAINFILYCSMSRQFRTTFGQLIRNRCTTTPRASSNTELQTTYVWTYTEGQFGPDLKQKTEPLCRALRYIKIVKNYRCLVCRVLPYIVSPLSRDLAFIR